MNAALNHQYLGDNASLDEITKELIKIGFILRRSAKNKRSLNQTECEDLSEHIFKASGYEIFKASRLSNPLFEFVGRSGMDHVVNGAVGRIAVVTKDLDAVINAVEAFNQEEVLSTENNYEPPERTYVMEELARIVIDKHRQYNLPKRMIDTDPNYDTIKYVRLAARAANQTEVKKIVSQLNGKNAKKYFIRVVTTASIRNNDPDYANKICRLFMGDFNCMDDYSPVKIANRLDGTRLEKFMTATVMNAAFSKSEEDFKMRYLEYSIRNGLLNPTL